MGQILLHLFKKTGKYNWEETVLKDEVQDRILIKK